MKSFNVRLQRVRKWSASDLPLVNMVVQKQFDYAVVDHGNNSFDTNRAFNRTKYTIKNPSSKHLIIQPPTRTSTRLSRGMTSPSWQTAQLKTFPTSWAWEMFSWHSTTERRCRSLVLQKRLQDGPKKDLCLWPGLSWRFSIRPLWEEIIAMATTKGELTKEAFSKKFNVSRIKWISRYSQLCQITHGLPNPSPVQWTCKWTLLLPK